VLVSDFIWLVSDFIWFNSVLKVLLTANPVADNVNLESVAKLIPIPLELLSKPFKLFKLTLNLLLPSLLKLLVFILSI
jgi:hypothetical protein